MKYDDMKKLKCVASDSDFDEILYPENNEVKFIVADSKCISTDAEKLRIVIPASVYTATRIKNVKSILGKIQRDPNPYHIDMTFSQIASGTDITPIVFISTSPNSYKYLTKLTKVHFDAKHIQLFLEEDVSFKVPFGTIHSVC